MLRGAARCCAVRCGAALRRDEGVDVEVEVGAGRGERGAWSVEWGAGSGERAHERLQQRKEAELEGAEPVEGVERAVARAIGAEGGGPVGGQQRRARVGGTRRRRARAGTQGRRGAGAQGRRGAGAQARAQAQAQAQAQAYA
jgi:hypothetical protein